MFTRQASWFGERKTVFVFLAAFRGGALVVAIALLTATGYINLLSWFGWTLVGLVIFYTLFKLLLPFNRYDRNFLNYVEFGFDFALCLSLPMVTGGLRSPFLLYCFSPILTAALVYPRKITFPVAGLPFISLVASQSLIYGVPIAEGFVFTELSSSLLIGYLAMSFLLAWLPYVMNINVSQSIKAKAIVEERNRLSRDMHDGLAQSLSVIKWKMGLLWKTLTSGHVMQSLNQLEDVMKLLEEAQYEAKAAIDQLHTSVKSDKGFVPSLAQYTTDFTREYGIRCDLHLSDGHMKLSALTEIEMLCVTQEALNNIRKHAGASEVHVSLESTGDSTVMIISDNGQGFDPDALNQGHGLVVMDERVRSINGQMAIDTSPGYGTRIVVKLPPPSQVL